MCSLNHPSCPSCLFGIVTSLAQGSNLKVEDFTAASLKYVLLLQLRSKTNMLISDPAWQPQDPKNLGFLQVCIIRGWLQNILPQPLGEAVQCFLQAFQALSLQQSHADWTTIALILKPAALQNATIGLHRS